MFSVCNQNQNKKENELSQKFPEKQNYSEIKMASMTVSAADLAALEVLLNEFFATQTSNERKREIEQVTVIQNQ